MFTAPEIRAMDCFLDETMGIDANEGIKNFAHNWSEERCAALIEAVAKAYNSRHSFKAADAIKLWKKGGAGADKALLATLRLGVKYGDL